MVELCTFFYYLNYYSGPSYSRLNPAGTSISAENQKLLGITPSSKYSGLYQIGNQNLYLSGNQIWQQDQSGNYYLEPLGTNTRFKQYTGDVTGFNKSGSDDSTVYDISPAYLYSKKMSGQTYVPFTAQQAPLQVMGYNPALGLGQTGGVYSPAIGNLLSAPTAMTTPTGSYGAGRFLGGTGGGLLNYSAPKGE